MSICCSKWLELFSKDVSIAELFPNIRTLLKVETGIFRRWVVNFFSKRVFFWKQAAAERPPIVGELCADLIWVGKGENIDHMLDKERVLQTGVIKASNTSKVFQLNESTAGFQ